MAPVVEGYCGRAYLEHYHGPHCYRDFVSPLPHPRSSRSTIRSSVPDMAYGPGGASYYALQKPIQKRSVLVQNVGGEKTKLVFVCGFFPFDFGGG
eukprot:428152-Rhodomonas_salina.2